MMMVEDFDAKVVLVQLCVVNADIIEFKWIGIAIAVARKTLESILQSKYNKPKMPLFAQQS
jgi:hypothetical protein